MISRCETGVRRDTGRQSDPVISGCLDGALINGGPEVGEAREVSAILGDRTGVIFGGVLYSISLDRFGFDRERFVRSTLMVCLGNRGAEGASDLSGRDLRCLFEIPFIFRADVASWFRPLAKEPATGRHQMKNPCGCLCRRGCPSLWRTTKCYFGPACRKAMSRFHLLRIQKSHELIWFMAWLKGLPC